MAKSKNSIPTDSVTLPDTDIAGLPVDVLESIVEEYRVSKDDLLQLAADRYLDLAREALADAEKAWRAAEKAADAAMPENKSDTTEHGDLLGDMLGALGFEADEKTKVTVTVSTAYHARTDVKPAEAVTHTSQLQIDDNGRTCFTRTRKLAAPKAAVDAIAAWQKLRIKADARAAEVVACKRRLHPGEVAEVTRKANVHLVTMLMSAKDGGARMVEGIRQVGAKRLNA